jgi:hypothetical protein
MAQPRVSCLQQVNDRSYIMGITRRANRERPLSTQAGWSAGPSERLKPDPQRPLVCIAMTTAGHAPQETSSETQSFQCPGRPERDVCPEFRLLLGRIVVGCDASGLPLWPGNRSSIALFGQPKSREQEKETLEMRIPGPAVDASSLREGYLSSQTSSMRQPLKVRVDQDRLPLDIGLPAAPLAAVIDDRPRAVLG